MTGSRMFSGKKYSLYDTSNTKAEADKQAKQLRKECKSVRVVKVAAITTGRRSAYAVYTYRC